MLIDNLQRPIPNYLQLPVKSHLPNTPQPSKQSPPAGEQVFNSRTCGWHLRWKPWQELIRTLPISLLPSPSYWLVYLRSVCNEYHEEGRQEGDPRNNSGRWPWLPLWPCIHWQLPLALHSAWALPQRVECCQSSVDIAHRQTGSWTMQSGISFALATSRKNIGGPELRVTYLKLSLLLKFFVLIPGFQPAQAARTLFPSWFRM